MYIAFGKLLIFFFIDYDHSKDVILPLLMYVSMCMYVMHMQVLVKARRGWDSRQRARPCVGVGNRRVVLSGVSKHS